MSDSDLHKEAMSIEAEAWKVVKAFDDAALAIGTDRRVPYAALILIMTSFVKSSGTPAAEILKDFSGRVFLGALHRGAPQ